MPADMRLKKQCVFIAVQSAGNILSQKAEGTFAEFLRILAHGQRMQVNDTVKAIVFVLQGCPVFNCP